MPKISSVFTSKLLGFLSLAAVFLFVSVQNSYASMKCSDPNATVQMSDGCIGAGKVADCGVCPSSDSTWQAPLIEVFYESKGDPADIIPSYSSQIKDGECEWIMGFRFCAEKTAAGENDNDSDKPMLCAFEAPLGSDHLNNVGCVDLPIAIGPPPFSNDAWKTHYYPNPEIAMGVPSTFVAPKVLLNICETDNSSATVTRCVQEQGGYKIGTRLRETLTLSPTGTNSFKESKDATDGRTFEARITSTRPNEICVYKTKEESGTTVDKLQGCLPRPGYMPAPTVSNVNSSSNLPKITVTMPGDSTSVDLWVNPNNYDSTATAVAPHECDYPAKVKFCAYRPCATTNTDGTCASWDDKMCIDGYDTAPLVVVNTATDTAATGRPPGNKSVAANQSFANLNAYDEFMTATPTKPNVSFTKAVSVYNAPKCYQYDNQGNCLNYASDSEALNLITSNFGTCCTSSTCSGIPTPYTDSSGTCLQYVRNTPGYDPYKINNITQPAQQMARPLNGVEMGFCVAIPKIWIQTVPGAYTYTAPSGCTTATVELWGGGSGGRNGSGSDDDWSGGGGAYVKASVPVTAGSSYNVVVGSGGVPFTPGFASRFANQVMANGGTLQTGGTSTCSNGATCLTQKNGNNGVSIHCGLMAGGGAWNPDTNQYSQWKESNSDSHTGPDGVWQCDDSDSFDGHDLHIRDLGGDSENNVASNFYYPTVPGVGGCSSDACPMSRSNDYNGNIGPGGPGKARITCN